MTNNRYTRDVPAWLRAVRAFRDPYHPIRPLLILAALVITVIAIATPMAWVLANGHAPGFFYLDAVPTPTATATLTPTETPTETPTASPSPTQTPTATLERPAVVSEVSEPVAPPAAREPEPVTGGNFAALPLPANTTVIWGAASDGASWPYCFYWAPTHEVVMVDGCGETNRVHELCHAHQHWTINGGASTGIDLGAWYGTGEGQSFAAAVAGSPFPWGRISTATNLLEDFAATCASWYLDPAGLQQTGGQARYSWAKENLP